tara:strand:- start:51 stop:620 length:570 start_codon:yes stop_codon:yes gene_type:complete
MPKWETYDDFMYEHLVLAQQICDRAIVKSDPKKVAMKATMLWEFVKDFAPRSYQTLVFDCCYIVGNATGNKVSVPFLQNISADLLDGRRVKAMARTEKGHWYLSEEGKEAIMKIFGNDEVLYNDAVNQWTTDEYQQGEKTDHWCEMCAVRMESGETRKDILVEADELPIRPILICPGCRKWEWDVDTEN